MSLPPSPISSFPKSEMTAPAQQKSIQMFIQRHSLKGSSFQRLNPSFCVVCVFAKPFHTMASSWASLTASVLIFSPSNSSSSSSEMLSSLVESGWVFKCACIRSGCFCQDCDTICYLLWYKFIFQRSLFLRTSLLFCEFSLNSLQLSCILFISHGKFPLFNPWILHFE